ncbi:MAG: hypothetical protein KF900_07625 [Bacteroidetes bacterium]|nr:hypothetical protein [Bacteroidota bacterium]
MKKIILSLSILASGLISCHQNEDENFMEKWNNKNRVIVQGTVSGRKDEEILETGLNTSGETDYTTKDIIHISINGKHYTGRTHYTAMLKELKDGDDISGVVNTKTNTLELAVNHTTGKKYFYESYISYFIKLALLAVFNWLLYMVVFQKFATLAEISAKVGDTLSLVYIFGCAILGGLSVLVVTPYFLIMNTYSLIVSNFFRDNFMY